MTRWAALITFVLVLGCSNLTEDANGVVEVEIRQPAITTIQVGQQLQLTAQASDKSGDPVNVAITWVANAMVTVDATGLVTGVAPGEGLVQAVTGNLSSARLALTVTAAPGPIVGPE
ncbi:MAG: Ig-like domain-containing protein [Gemmatimonadales bacterium]